jgi:biotin operon repressor
MIVWSVEMIEQLVSAYPLEPSAEVARKLGVSKCTVEKMAAALGLCKFNGLSAEKLRVYKIVCEEFSQTSARSLARKVGMSKTQVCNIASQFGLKKDGEVIARQRSISMRRALHYEAFKRDSGLKGNMKRAIGFDKHRYNLVYRLRKDGYIIGADGRTVYYTPDMQRHPIRERHAEAMGLTFREYIPNKKVAER